MSRNPWFSIVSGLGGFGAHYVPCNLGDERGWTLSFTSWGLPFFCFFCIFFPFFFFFFFVLPSFIISLPLVDFQSLFKQFLFLSFSIFLSSFAVLLSCIVLISSSEDFLPMFKPFLFQINLALFLWFVSCFILMLLVVCCFEKFMSCNTQFWVVVVYIKC